MAPRQPHVTAIAILVESRCNNVDGVNFPPVNPDGLRKIIDDELANIAPNQPAIGNYKPRLLKCGSIRTRFSFRFDACPTQCMPPKRHSGH